MGEDVDEPIDSEKEQKDNNQAAAKATEHKSALLFWKFHAPLLGGANERNNWIPINKFEYYSDIIKMTRIQYGFCLAYALTIHRSQGATLDKAVIDLLNNEKT